MKVLISQALITIGTFPVYFLLAVGWGERTLLGGHELSTYFGMLLTSDSCPSC